MQKYHNRALSFFSVCLLLLSPWTDSYYYGLTFLGAFIIGGIGWKLDYEENKFNK